MSCLDKVISGWDGSSYKTLGLLPKDLSGRAIGGERYSFEVSGR